MQKGSLNKVMLVGHLGGDPEVRHIPSGVAVANFNMATNESGVTPMVIFRIKLNGTGALCLENRLRWLVNC